MTSETSGVYDELGIDAEDIKWQDLSICVNQPTSMFYEEYESNPRTAELVDQMCLSCPVRAICLATGVENGEYGTWGAVFLVAGRADENKNSHKTAEVWQQIRDGV